MFPAYGSPCKAYRSKLEALPWMCCIQVRFFYCCLNCELCISLQTSHFSIEIRMAAILSPKISQISRSHVSIIYLSIKRMIFFKSRIFDEMCSKHKFLLAFHGSHWPTLFYDYHISREQFSAWGVEIFTSLRSYVMVTAYNVQNLLIVVLCPINKVLFSSILFNVYLNELEFWTRLIRAWNIEKSCLYWCHKYTH
jgi:hypothetical protein